MYLSFSYLVINDIQCDKFMVLDNVSAMIILLCSHIYLDKFICFFFFLRYPPSTESERQVRLRTALSMAESIDEGRRAEQRARAKERRKQMEKERKKAIRAAKQRQKEAKLKRHASFKSVRYDTK